MGRTVAICAPDELLVLQFGHLRGQRPQFAVQARVLIDALNLAGLHATFGAVVVLRTRSLRFVVALTTLCGILLDAIEYAPEIIPDICIALHLQQRVAGNIIERVIESTRSVANLNGLNQTLGDHHAIQTCQPECAKTEFVGRCAIV